MRKPKQETESKAGPIDSAIDDADNPLAALTAEEAVVGAKLLPLLTKKIAAEADAKYAAGYRAQFDELQAGNATALKAAIAEMRESMKPLGDEELTKLLTQEYATFDVKLAGPDGSVVEFVVRELPASDEIKLVKSISKSIAPIMTTISQTEWISLASGSELQRLQKILELVPDSLEVICGCVAICLHPKHDQAWCTGKWVMENVGTNRILSIVMAQISASRYRDFFSLVSRLFQQTRMMTQ